MKIEIMEKMTKDELRSLHAELCDKISILRYNLDTKKIVVKIERRLV